MATKNLQWSSVLTRKAAILALFHDPEIVTKDPIFKAFLAAGHSLGVVDTKHEVYSIDPVLAFFRSSPDNHTLPIADLARKLSWLLGVCGFMRPDDIFCTDVAKSGVIGDKLQLAVVFPKEKRGKQRIIKYVHLSRHLLRSGDLSCSCLHCLPLSYHDDGCCCTTPQGQDVLHRPSSSSLPPSLGASGVHDH